MIKAVLFDLDDTMYDERTFYAGGFAAVAVELAKLGFGSVDRILQLLLEFHAADRRDVLQKLASVLGFPNDWVPRLAQLIRSHRPNITLFPDAEALLPHLRAHYKLGCVTDGHAAVQRAKLESLGLAALMDAIVVTDEFGRDYWKPHARPFLSACAALQVEPGDAVFVGDNPDRDHLGACNAGLSYVRVRRPGGYYTTAQNLAHLPPCTAEIVSFAQLPAVLARLSCARHSPC